MRLSIVILAAGKGKRMYSDRPKVLHELGGRSMLSHVLDTAAALEAGSRLVVYGHGGEAVPEAFGRDPEVGWIRQGEQLGTGHAVGQALPEVPDGGVVLVLYGDVPLVRAQTLRPLIDSARAGKLGLLTVSLDDPAGYGRIVRDTTGHVLRIVEERDAEPEERRIREVNTGILAVEARRLRGWVSRLRNANVQGEYYLTDCIAMAVADRVPVEAFTTGEPWEVQGVNDRHQLAELERHLQLRQAEALMARGVTLVDPARLDIRGSVEVGRDVVIDVSVVLEGRVRLGDGVRIGPFCVVRDAELGPGTRLDAYSHVDGAIAAEGVRIGPFARVRPGTRLDGEVHVGNFVEVKKATVGRGSKANHLSYIGDAEVGAGVNIGAGTITCNYDGANKHLTVIEDGVFIGSNSALVAPIRVGEGATVGAGSTITRTAPAGSLTVTRAPQRTVKDWKRPAKGEKG